MIYRNPMLKKEHQTTSETSVTIDFFDNK